MVKIECRLPERIRSCKPSSACERCGFCQQEDNRRKYWIETGKFNMRREPVPYGPNTYYKDVFYLDLARMRGRNRQGNA